ncbi:MAG: transposase [Verrucomicrobiota bacterium]|nr:transposase [Verrucomicrobiota bacterium]
MNTGQAEYAVVIGIDWAHTIHVLSMRDMTGQITAMELEQSPEAIRRWIEDLKAKYPGQRIAVAMEQTKGPLAYALREYVDVLDLYPVNPMTLASFRKAWATSGAKDDPSDADFLRLLLEKHRELLRLWQPTDQQTHQLAFLSEKRRKLVDIRTKLVQQLMAALKDYYPQALTLIGTDLHDVMSRNFILAWPTFEEFKRARRETITSFYYRHNCRSRKRIQERLDRIAAEVPLTTNPALVEPSKMMAVALVKQIVQMNASIRQFDKAIAETFKAHQDAPIFRSFPGAGASLAPRILTIFGTDRDQWADASAVQKFSGIAPVVERSGKTMWVHRRFACPFFAR